MIVYHRDRLTEIVRSNNKRSGWDFGFWFKGNSLKDNGAGSNSTGLAQGHAAAQDGARTDDTMILDRTVMVHLGAGVQQDVVAEVTSWLDSRAGHELVPRDLREVGSEPGCRMDDSENGMLEAVAVEQGYAVFQVADADGDRGLSRELELVVSRPEMSRSDDGLDDLCMPAIADDVDLVGFSGHDELSSVQAPFLADLNDGHFHFRRPHLAVADGHFHLPDIEHHLLELFWHQASFVIRPEAVAPQG